MSAPPDAVSGVAWVVANFGASVAVQPCTAETPGGAGVSGPPGSGATPPAAPVSGTAAPVTERGGARGSITQAVPLRTLPLLVAGDRVRCEPQAGGSLRVVELLPRASVLERPDPRGRPKPLAANLTHLGIVSATPPGIDTLLIDEFCVGAHRSGIDAAVVVNKADLLDADARAAVEATLEVYAAIGYPTALVEARDGAGVEPLRALVAGGEGAPRTIALVGASGVGKSSIVQRLLPDLEVRVGAISAATGLGAHTTSVTCRYALPGGGAVVDSPGVRRYSVAHLEPGDVRAGYREIARLAQGCRFGDCAHVVEPGCAVRDALETGAVAPWRYANYRRLAGLQ